MGLDLIPQSIAKPGYEAEWRRLLEMEFSDEALSEDIAARFQEISVPPYACIGAPRVGFDKAADDWITKAHRATTTDEIETCLREFHGYYAIALVGPPGIPKYSNGGLYDGIDETSFRGAFLNECENLLGSKMLHRAWENMWPEEAVAYGKELLRLAEEAEQRKPVVPPTQPSLLGRLGLVKPKLPMALFEQIDIIRAAGQWYVFWGERGHPIRAWF